MTKRHPYEINPLALGAIAAAALVFAILGVAAVMTP